MLGTLIKWTFVGSLLLLPVACWRADELPGGIVPVADLAEAPDQSPIDEAPFDVRQGGVRYHVTPRFRYSLRGLVVSRRAHDGDYMVHRRWNDHLNVADICVVWGDNATADLAAFEFRSGEFTCFFRTRDEAAWRAFRPDQLSNNHLLSDDAYLRDRIADVQVGDQIRVDGYLASYANDTGFHRGTSTTRTDTGNGACETVYVTGFRVLAPSPSPWPQLANAAGFGLVASAFLWLAAVLKGWI